MKLGGVSDVALPQMDSFNKTEAAFFSCRLCFLRVFSYINLPVPKNKTKCMFEAAVFSCRLCFLGAFPFISFINKNYTIAVLV